MVIERHVEIALEEINQTTKGITYNYTYISTHRKYCTYVLCNIGFESSFHASHRSSIQNI